MTLCNENKRISKEVLGFIKNVSDVKEESITDYLVWKWRELSTRFNYLNIETFTRDYENRISGADFELELWVVGDRQAVPMVIQAKKFLKEFDTYCSKLNYEADSGRQIDVLLSYATSRKLLPFYLFYSIPDDNTKIRCGTGLIDPVNDEVSLYLASAYEIKNIADTYSRRKLSKNKILEVTNAFSCIFCCPVGPEIGEYFKMYFPSIIDNHMEAFEYNSNNMPKYVQMLLGQNIGEFGKESISEILNEYNLYRIRNIAVLDVRGAET
jgi:hypothetical protein